MTTPTIHSRLEIFSLASRQRRVLYTDTTLFEAPNWSRCGQFLIINRDGLLYKVNLSKPVPELINTGFANRCNNDHGISPDGTQIVISHHDPESDNGSILYCLPIEGGLPQKITPFWPSYWHGWSPDGKQLAFVGGRAGHNDLKIYSVDIASGEEKQLTFGDGLDDGPDYSPCGKYIYFNAFRKNRMQIWRMDADGSNPMHLVISEHSDWFAHPSPDGKKLVFIRYTEDQGQSHPFGRDVQLMLLNLETNELTQLTDIFYGGQGTFNVPCWSPDSEQFAFVSYEQSGA